MTHPMHLDRVRRFLPPLLALSMAIPAFSQTTNAPGNPPAKRPADNEEVVTLSPFVVSTTRDSGYYAANTLAGSRMNTNLADLGASISVITKQQMEDTASVDINDIFRYEVNTEGSLTYTPATPSFRNDGFLDVNAGGTQGNSVSNFTNAGANRVRGLGTPSTAVNYYPAIGAVPFDSYNVQSIEISRGPNSMLFGLGSPAGIVNQTTAQAQLHKRSANVSMRTDQYGSRRASFNFNQGLGDHLAIYGAAVYDDRRFDRKPSYDKTERFYGALTLKPFEKTTIRFNAEQYENRNRRPNTLTPRDFITQWNLAGKPTYDSLNRTITRNGQVAGVYVINANSPYAQTTRDFIRSMPNYNPALRGTSATAFNGTDTNFSFYNGISIFGDAAATNSAGFIASSNTPSANALYVPGVAWANQSRSIMQIAGGQLANWFHPTFGYKYLPNYGTATNPAANPATGPADSLIWANSTWSDVSNRSYASSNGWTGIGNGIIGYKYPGVTDQSIYDWTGVNINSMNFGHDKNTNLNLEFEQDLPGDFFLSGGWFRQDFSSRTNYTVAQLNVATLFVDINKYRPDGTANPYYGKPYVEDQDPDSYVTELEDDHYRLMLAWTPDFTQNSNWTKWLGRHQVLGLWSRDESLGTSIRQRLQYISSTTDGGRFRYLRNPNNNADGTPSGWNRQTTSLRRTFYLAAPGDANGVVTQSAGTWDYLNYTGDIKVYDYATSQFIPVNMTTAYDDFDAGTGRNQRVVESRSAGMTSHLWNDRLIATFGVRKDNYKARNSSTALTALTDVDGTVLAPAITNPQKWVNGEFQRDFLFKRWNRWDRITGTTRTLGGVLRPFQKWSSIDRRAESGSLFWEFVRDFGVSYNKSNNFNPPAEAQGTLDGQPLPKPSGEGQDYGFQFSLFDNKLFARVTWFEGSNENERISATATLNRLTDNIDQTLFRNWARTIVLINAGADPRAPGFGENLSTAQEDAVQLEAAKIWKLPYNYYASLPFARGATRSAEATGMEAEVNYNPRPNWTIKFTFGKQDTKYSNVLKEFDFWYDIRNPVWQAAKASDYLLPAYQGLAKYTTSGGREVDLTNFWTSYGFNTAVRLDDSFGNTSVARYYDINVTPQVQLSRDLEGQSASGQRKYRWSLLSTYAFTEGSLKGVFVGGSQRWEDKAVVGYYGRASGANGTSLDVSDISRPIYSDANFYTDLWIGYRRPILDDKVQMKLQLNVGNVFEGGGLRTEGVNYDGTPYSFRIVDPRLFTFTASFDY